MQLFKKFNNLISILKKNKTRNLAPKKNHTQKIPVSLITTVTFGFYLVCISQINSSEVHQIKNKNHLTEI